MLLLMAKSRASSTYLSGQIFLTFLRIILSLTKNVWVVIVLLNSVYDSKVIYGGREGGRITQIPKLKTISRLNYKSIT